MSKLPNINNCRIAIIGLGYVGLPLAIEFSKCKRSFRDNSELNRRIIGFDINNYRINELKKGIDKTKEVSANDILTQRNIEFTDNPSIISEADVYIVTVPTPIDSSRSPDLSILKKACKTIGSAIKQKYQADLYCSKLSLPIIIFESTVYPGATEEVCIPIIEKESGISACSDINNNGGFGFGYSPERINPGDKDHRISSITKVTSGNTKNVSEWIDCLYASIIEAGTYNAASIKVAEAAKVIENTQRDINIALINELSIIFRHLDIDTLDVLKAASTKWNFLPFKPGLVGGHCIGVDPYYLTYKSEQAGYQPQIILAGRRINDGMGTWHVEQLILEMVRKGINIAGSQALVLGFTFKENCPDIRNTKVMDIINQLNRFNIENTIVDPCADNKEAFEEYGIDLHSKIPEGKEYSIIIVAVAHKFICELTIENWKLLCSKQCIILDLKGIVPKDLNPRRP
tara:strand:+ start:1223 stop:2599 length:1377 start_codon:yes stop_codon:yes gene_type:complete